MESHEEPLRRSNKPTPPRILPGPVPQVVDGPQLPTAARDARLAGLLNHGHAAYRKRHAEEDGEDNGQDDGQDGGQGGGPGVNVD